jgi:hypothetical protein
VPLTLSGSIADDIRTVLDTMGMSMTQCSETYSKKNGFSLMITNNDYTTQARDLLSGILNPIDMTAMVLSSILAYQDEKSIIALQKETTIQSTPLSVDGKKMIRYTLQPVGDRFRYRFRDAGAYLDESWLTCLTLTVDPNTMLAHDLTVTKHSRIVTAEQHASPPPLSAEYHYVFMYTGPDPHALPARMDLFVNNTLSLSIQAEYLPVDRYYLFATRDIIYYLPDHTTASLHIDYNTYSFSYTSPTPKTGNADGSYAKKLKRAAEHARKAMAELNTGRIQAARTHLQIIVAQYPGTPQAIEARELLSGLPEGL